jgi:hypothetical protein
MAEWDQAYIALENYKGKHKFILRRSADWFGHNRNYARPIKEGS